LRGVAQISAVTIVAELGQISRFAHARQLMGYSGAVSREHSSGERIRRGLSDFLCVEPYTTARGGEERVWQRTIQKFFPKSCWINC
jgi:hypothetical protein